MKITLFYQPGELEFKIQAQKYGYTTEYVGDDPEYWCQDIDFILNDKVNVEVKWDSWINQTGNLFIETVNPRSQGGNGWYRFCQADYLAYGDSKNNKFYMIKMQDLKEYIAAYEPEEKTTNDNAKGYLIPLANLKYKTL